MKALICKKNWELVNFCEFDAFAIKSYCAIHDVDEQLNLGDITKVDETKLEDFNMMTWGFPCTDISCAGKQKGFLDEDGNKTRSGMYYEGIRILRYKKPALSIIENVKNLTGKRFKKEFETILSDLDEIGYNTYWKVLNAKDFGIPQNRERVFIISIRKDLDNGKFEFPKGFDNGVRLKDVLEDEVDEKYYISDDKVRKFLGNLKSENICENSALKLDGNNYNQRCVVHTPNDFCRTIIGSGGNGGYHAVNEPKVLVESKNNSDICKSEKAPRFIGNINRPDFETGYAGCVWDTNNISPTLTTMQGGGRQPHIININQDEIKMCRIRIRKLTPKECFRLMGFNDSDYKAVSKVVSNSQLYKQAGNSIVVDVLYYILVELYTSMPYLFDELKLSSFFSGIGAFESALNRLYKGINTGNFTKPQAG